MGKKVALTCFERLTLTVYDGGVIPKEGNAITARAIKTLYDKLPLSGEEMEEMGITVVESVTPEGTPTTGLKFEVAGKDSPQEQVDKAKKCHEARMKERDIMILDVERTVIVNALKKLDETQKMKPLHLPLWEKFVENWEKEDAK